ncbi:pollen-specific leucine-rich repeat extensin 1 [Labeo rohita]|uniref:Pollen-specific leucine-rich repeat extensin 1 n=1 Tax=Labeo rohita TaxID=84645 RepID=A0A498MP53_LABRO|nr:pollen-specific leucine-rich repeat extensin 1 [Labeo rohita]
MSAYFRQGATTVAPMSDNCSQQEAPMARLFTLGLSVPASSMRKRQVQKARSQACLFQERREYKPQTRLRQRAPKSVKPPQTSPVLEYSPQGAPVPRLFTMGLSIPAFSTRSFCVQKGQSQRSCLFQERRGYKPQASLRQREPKPVKLPLRSPVPEDFPQECSSEGAPMLERFSQGTLAETPQEEPMVANVSEEGPHGAPMPKLFTLGISIPALSTRNFHVRKGRSQCRDYKPQASKRQREPKPVKLPQRSPVPEDFPQECFSERAPVLECFSQGTPAETPQEEPVLADFLEGGPHEAPIPKLFTLGVSIPVLSTKKYRLHKHQASLTHRTRLPVITAEKSPVPEEGGPHEAPIPKLFTLGVSIPVLSTKKYRLHKHQASLTHRTRLPVITAEKSPMPESSLLDEATVEAIEPYSSPSNKAAKAHKEAPMPECSSEEGPMVMCSPERTNLSRGLKEGEKRGTKSSK